MTSRSARLAKAGDQTAPRPRSAPTTLHRRAAGRVGELGGLLTAFYAIVVGVAGASSVALLAWPSGSGVYFSWNLGPPSAAALIGGLYLASVIVFGYALTRPRAETRSLNYGVLALALPTLWFTASHHHVFEWDRPQAIGWVVLFLSAPISIALDLRAGVSASTAQPSPLAVRATLAVIALSGAGLAGSIWVESSRQWLTARSPIPIVGLTGHYVGAWCAFVATSATAATIRGRPGDVRLLAVLLGSVSIGTLIAIARTAGDLGPNGPALVAGLIVLGVAAAALLRRSRRRLPGRGRVSARSVWREHSER